MVRRQSQVRKSALILRQAQDEGELVLGSQSITAADTAGEAEIFNLQIAGIFFAAIALM
jgi:hypothetical protein